MDFSKLDDWERQIKSGNLTGIQNEIGRLRPGAIERHLTLHLPERHNESRLRHPTHPLVSWPMA